MKKNLAFNPYLPSWEYIPDAEPRIFGDRLYVYGSHDRFGGIDFCMNDYVCWSAPLDDLSDWRYEGVIYKTTQDPQNKDGKMYMFAPDCVLGVDGRYYLYYQLNILPCTCVAVAKTPVGPFEYYGCVQYPDGTPYGRKKGDTFAFDPGVLVDDDGKAYLYVGFAPMGKLKMQFLFSGNRTEEAICLELEPDMKTIKGNPSSIVPGHYQAKGTPFEGHGFFEASSIRKIGDTYYFVYSSELSHELCYAVSKYPNHDFKYGGTLVSIADIGYQGNTKLLNYTGNTHGGMVEVNGQWYIFYHRQTNRVKCARQACAEPITILPDGSIPQVEMTSSGLNNGPLPGVGHYESYIACNLGAKHEMVKSDYAEKKDKKKRLPFFTQSGADREEDGDQYIANLKDGSFAGFKYFEFDGTKKTISVTVRGDANGTFNIYSNQKMPPIASISLSPSADWTSFSGEFGVLTGVAPLYFIYKGTGVVDFKDFTIE